MPALYDRAGVFVNASDIDNQPLSIIEAFASGLPVVTTDAGGIPDMVTNEETGLLVDRNDHEAIAESVIRLLSDNPLAQRLASLGEEASHKYTWAAVRRDWLRLYSALSRHEIALIERVESSSART
jgi:glycosyltransferase involved in cell wall biosynthesis